MIKKKGVSISMTAIIILLILIGTLFIAYLLIKVSGGSITGALKYIQSLATSRGK